MEHMGDEKKRRNTCQQRFSLICCEDSGIHRASLVGGLEHLFIFHMLGILIPTDFHIFQRG